MTAARRLWVWWLVSIGAGLIAGSVALSAVPDPKPEVPLRLCWTAQPCQEAPGGYARAL